MVRRKTRPLTMAVLGQSRRFNDQPATSGLTRSTDIVRPRRLVRFVPNNGSSQHPARLGYHGQFRLSSRSGRRFGWRLFQKSQKSLTGFCVQFLGIQRTIMIWICGSETLLDDREILVLRERSIVVRIGSGELFRSQSASQFTFVESAIMVAV